MSAPILLFGIGNPSRGDDALGPLLLEQLADLDGGQVERLSDFQLQIEHSMDLLGRRLALFIDASVAIATPVQLSPLKPSRDPSYTSHALSPTALLGVYQQVQASPPPPCFMLAIAGSAFELGSPLSAQARTALCEAETLTRELLRHPHAGYWTSRCHTKSPERR
jgi:hydrogenase maturation protease